MRHLWAAAAVVVVLALAGCGGSGTGAAVDGGAAADALPPASDAARPGDSGPGDGAIDGGSALSPHRGMATLAGAVQARSPRYRVLMSTGESPGGGGTARSPAATVRSGFVGATQGR